jgi:predicted cupin superfamily sugar epimerase
MEKEHEKRYLRRMNGTAQKLIEKLRLEPLEMEGGYFRRLQPQDRSAGSAIYFLLSPETHSKIHRLPIDEIYHFYLGDPVELLLLEENGKAETITLHNDVLAGANPQYVVSKDIWQGSCLKPGGQFALLGTTMAPAFEYADFKTPESLESLLAKYPTSFHEQIKKLY